MQTYFLDAVYNVILCSSMVGRETVNSAFIALHWLHLPILVFCGNLNVASISAPNAGSDAKDCCCQTSADACKMLEV